ncbi:MAG: SRPBCC family protein [Gemmatimonadaceae bacterium]
MPGYEHLVMELIIERIDAEDFFSFRWHPYAIDPNIDYSSESTTLVEFHLSEADGATTLTVVESGFDKLPAARRDEAFRMNDGGWTSQLKNIERYVAG